jgi:hypothetical protein
VSAAGAAGGGAAAQRGRWSAAADPMARTVFVLLVIASVAAFFITQRLKHTPTVVQRFERTTTFAPTSGEPERREERISFKVSHAGTVTVSIVDSNLNTVATLVRDHELPRYKQFSLRWNGRRGPVLHYLHLVSATGHRTLVPVNGGPLAPPGEYRVRVDLSGESAPIYSPWSFVLERR